MHAFSRNCSRARYALICLIMLSPVHTIQCMDTFKKLIPQRVQRATPTQKVLFAAAAAVMGYIAVRTGPALVQYIINSWYGPQPSRPALPIQPTGSPAAQQPAPLPSVMPSTQPNRESSVAQQLSLQTSVQPQKAPAEQDVTLIKQLAIDLILDSIFYKAYASVLSNTYKERRSKNLKMLFTIAKYKPLILEEVVMEYAGAQSGQRIPSAVNVLELAEVTTKIPQEILNLGTPANFLDYWTDPQNKPEYSAQLLSVVDRLHNIFEEVKHYLERTAPWSESFRMHTVFNLLRQKNRLLKKFKDNKLKTKQLNDFGKRLMEKIIDKEGKLVVPEEKYLIEANKTLLELEGANVIKSLALQEQNNPRRPVISISAEPNIAEVIFDLIFDEALQYDAKVGVPKNTPKDFETLNRLFTVIELRDKKSIKTTLEGAKEMPGSISSGAASGLYRATPNLTIPQRIAALKKDTYTYLNYWLNLDVSILYESDIAAVVHDFKPSLDAQKRISEAFHLIRNAKKLQQHASQDDKKKLGEFCTRWIQHLLHIPQRDSRSMIAPTRQDILEQRAQFEKIKQSIKSHAHN